MTRWKITIEYDGRPFCGWQVQTNALSVQQVVETAIRKFSGETVKTIVAGRTDSGVHAYAQVAHFDLEKEADGFVVRDALNAHLRPHPVSILKAEPVADNFDARFSATKRHYLYRVINRKPELTLDKGRAWRIGRTLDIEAMQKAAAHLIGRHDFSSFRASECQARTAIRTLEQLDVLPQEGEILFKVSARSFLHHQVRKMVGALVDVGRSAIDHSSIPEHLARKIPGFAQMAPAHGLYFVKVDYLENQENAS